MKRMFVSHYRTKRALLSIEADFRILVKKKSRKPLDRNNATCYDLNKRLFRWISCPEASIQVWQSLCETSRQKQGFRDAPSRAC